MDRPPPPPPPYKPTTIFDHPDTATPFTCPATKSGWLWHCSVHDAHGAGASYTEASHVADAHSEWSDPDECDIQVWEVLR